MLSNNFIKALPIYPKKYENEMNISLFFAVELTIKEEATLKITGNNCYRIFDNGKLIGYGPARAAHNYFRIDLYKIEKKSHHRIVIELSGYNCNSYYFANSLPFIQAEVIKNDKVIAYTGDIKFKCYFNNSRLQKVSRFSYQRTFSESYVIRKNIFDFYKQNNDEFKEIECQVCDSKKYLSRNVNYPTLNELKFRKVEEGTFKVDPSFKKYEDRYMYTEHLKIFDKKEWEDNPNDYISQLVFERNKIESLKKSCFYTYKLENSKTGFIFFELDCLEDSKVYFIFDEIDSKRTKNLIDISFYRNTTNNIISYDLRKGKHKHICMEPYTMKYLRVIVAKGEIQIKKINLILYENPDTKGVTYDFENKKIQKVVDAAISTFAQNAVDVLTDCPSRERAGWLTDSYFTSMCEYLVTMDNKVERNFLENYYLCEQLPSLPEGMIPMCYPGDHQDGVFIPNWAMFYILELDKYYERTKDKDTITNSLMKVQGIMNYFKKFENEFGLLENLENWIFVEWSKANDGDYVCGVNFPCNMLYYAVLIACSRLFEDEKYLYKAKLIKEKINELSFNGKFYEDNKVRNDNNELVSLNHITETCQYYAFFFNIATKETKKELYELLFHKFGPRRNVKKVYPNVAKSNVFIGDYLRLFVLLRDGYIEKVDEETIDYFYKMAVQTGTLWEHDSSFASLNHGLTSSIFNIVCQLYFSLVSIDFKEKQLILSKKRIKSHCSISFNLPNGKLQITNKDGNIEILNESNFNIKYI